jgi:hypothetical protein
VPVGQTVALLAGIGLGGVGRHGSIKAACANLQGLTRGVFLAPQRAQLAVIDVLLDGIAYHRPRLKSGWMASSSTDSVPSPNSAKNALQRVSETLLGRAWPCGNSILLFHAMKRIISHRHSKRATRCRHTAEDDQYHCSKH